jgi:glycosyltransferase involved in cell wall biosynthesis
VVYSATGAVLCGGAAAALTRTAHIWHIHEILQQPRLMVKFLSWIYAAFSRRLVVVSQAVYDHWATVNPRLRDKMTVIYNGVDLQYFSPGSMRARVRRRLGLRRNEVVVGCLGRIGTWKGQEVLVQALQQLHSATCPVLGLIAGGTLPGEEYRLQELEAQIQALGLAKRIRLQPFQQDVRPILEALDVVAVPSAKPEPFGMVILEAMAFGLPVIATNIGGSPEVVQDGVTGYLVPPNDAPALAAAVLALARSAPLRRRFGQAGRKRVAALFSLPRYQKRIVEFFASQ